MKVALPHQLGRAEARRRLREGIGELEGQLPGAIGAISTHWTSEDQLALAIRAMGQDLRGAIDIEDNRLVIALDLPSALALFEPMIAAALRAKGQKLLAKP